MRTFKATVMLVLVSTTFYQAHAAECVAPIEPGAQAFDFLVETQCGAACLDAEQLETAATGGSQLERLARP